MRDAHTDLVYMHFMLDDLTILVHPHGRMRKIPPAWGVGRPRTPANIALKLYEVRKLADRCIECDGSGCDPNYGLPDGPKVCFMCYGTGTKSGAAAIEERMDDRMP